MIPKAKAPGLNREQRRHPERYRMTSVGKQYGMPWLLMGLLRRGGYMGEGVGIMDLSTGQMVGGPNVLRPAPAPSAKPGFLAKVGRFFRRLTGG